jgi:methionine aminotransferase
VNQYCRPACHLPLAHELSEEYNLRWSAAREANGIPLVDPLTMVVNGCGVTQMMYLTCMSLLKPGEEVVILEPAFDIYSEQIKLAGGIVRPVSLDTCMDAGNGGILEANDVFQMNWEKFEASLNEKTRMFVLNTPHNVSR